MIGKRKALLMTYLFVFFWRTEWFVLVLAAWQKGRQNEGYSPAKPSVVATGYLQPLWQRGPWCSGEVYCTPSHARFRVGGWPHSSHTQGPAQAVGASALGTGGMVREGSAVGSLWVQETSLWQSWRGVESCSIHGCSFTRQMGFWG